MPTLPREQPDPPPTESHRARRMAESFGVDAQRYDQSRPGYPEALVARIVAGSPGTDVLDVGCGTGIAARQFQAAGCTVLGVEPDVRMAEFARARGLQVEVSSFEAWESGGRRYDAVVAAQSWHWVDPVAGAVKAAEVLRPGGRLAIFGHVYEPAPEVAEAFAAVYRRVVPDSPFNRPQTRSPLDLYQAMYANVADRIREAGIEAGVGAGAGTRCFDEPEQWRFDWEKSYTRDAWLELLPTTGGLTQLRPEQVTEVLDAVGAAIDSLGGAFTMTYTTLATTAVRTDAI
ncbi:class I SAM-dependent methyltransferase [Streptacidiphilus carbonis]|uniref:class I SAM-dependent methyltransferase n=1 Tax=Streptacidiphilus carbonis TaxID=105422 RepID=UPI0005A61A64|nr:class I SAM-dependent methyltransferase [Streptacidiphilus carbonis]